MYVFILFWNHPKRKFWCTLLCLTIQTCQEKDIRTFIIGRRSVIHVYWHQCCATNECNNYRHHGSDNSGEWWCSFLLTYHLKPNKLNLTREQEKVKQTLFYRDGVCWSLVWYANLWSVMESALCHEMFTWSSKCYSWEE